MIYYFNSWWFRSLLLKLFAKNKILNNLKENSLLDYFFDLMEINKKKLWYYILWIFGALILSILIINIYVLSFYKGQFFEEVKELKQSKVWLVLWASVYKNRTPSDTLKNRLDIALEAYDALKVQQLILLGANSINEYTEPVTMLKYLLETGVMEYDLYLDYAGFAIYDSLYLARDIFWVKIIFIFTHDSHL